MVDNPGLFKKFGDVVTDVEETYRRRDVACAVFVGANPRNNLRLEGTYAMVQRLEGTQSTNPDDGELKPRHETWQAFRTDEDWELVYRWKRTSKILGTSEVTIEWEIPEDVEEGTYRLAYFGDSKSLGGTITAFEGVSAAFDVV